MQECFKNIRDVDKKIRLLELYVFGNVAVHSGIMKNKSGMGLSVYRLEKMCSTYI